MGDYTWQVKVVARFFKEVISAVVAACGTGKTRAAIKIALKKNLPVIVIVPKNLTRQWRDDIHEIAGDDQDVWIYDVVEDHKRPDEYRKRFIAWAKEDDDSR